MGTVGELNAPIAHWPEVRHRLFEALPGLTTWTLLLATPSHVAVFSR